MSNRPPSTYQIYVTGTGGGGSSDPARFTLGASGPTTVPGTIGVMHLAGVEFLSPNGSQSFIFTPDTVPSGVTVPITRPVNGLSFADIIPASIDGATTAFPFALHYGPLGIGGR